MQLTQILSDIDALPDDHYICARRPWSRDCEVMLVPYLKDLGIQESVRAKGYEYFLEVEVTREVLEGLLPFNPTHEQIVDFVLHYAEHDAFPAWANELCSH